MSFISFSDHKLIEHTQQLAATERNIIAQVLDALAEIDRRRLYLDRGYGSLFAFCTEFLGYSGSSAQRRISSMRLLKKMPTIEKEEIADKLVTGALNLTHLSLVSQASKELSAPKVKELLNLVENTPTQECEKILAQEIGFELKRDRVRPVAKDKMELTITVDVETVEMFEQFKNLTAAKNPAAEMGVTLKLALEIALKKVDPGAKRANLRNATTVTAVESLYIPVKLKSAIWKRDKGQCQFVDPKTQKQCASRYRLHFDHHLPRAMGGMTSETNLRLLCANHNTHLGREIQRMLI